MESLGIDRLHRVSGVLINVTSKDASETSNESVLLAWYGSANLTATAEITDNTKLIKPSHACLPDGKDGDWIGVRT